MGVLPISTQMALAQQRNPYAPPSYNQALYHNQAPPPYGQPPPYEQPPPPYSVPSAPIETTNEMRTS